MIQKKQLAELIVLGTVATFALTASAEAGATCDRVASPTGSDSAQGTPAAPFKTAQRLVKSLQPGQTGCLRAGTYSENVMVSNSGTANAPVTLTSYPGETATIVGRFWISRGANYVTVDSLNLNGVNQNMLPSPTINADHATFSNDDVTNGHTAICFLLGSAWGSADSTLIFRDRIHDCGIMPPQNHEHGIYVESASNTRIEWNLIYDNADRGIQLYPDAQSTIVDHNVIDGNGENVDFSGAGGLSSSNANVYDNIISNAAVRSDVVSWYPAGTPAGRNNILQNNCIWGGRMGTIDSSNGGFTSLGNVIGNPQFVNSAAHDYRLMPNSPCMGRTGDIALAIASGFMTAATSGANTTHFGRPRAGIAAHSRLHRRANHLRAAKSLRTRMHRRKAAQHHNRTHRGHAAIRRRHTARHRRHRPRPSAR
jgi:parallel beta-helix repeat protein